MSESTWETLQRKTSIPEMANYYTALHLAYSIQENSQPPKELNFEEIKESVLKPLVMANQEEEMNKGATKLLAPNSGSVIYHLVKNLSDDEYQRGLTFIKKGMPSDLQEGFLKEFSFITSKQGLLNRISETTLDAGMYLNPVAGEKVSVKSFGTILTGAINSLKNSIKGFLEKNFSDFKQR